MNPDKDLFIPQFKVYMQHESADMVAEVLASGYIGQGPKVEQFEKELQAFLGYEYGVTVNSGTSALWLALHLIGVGPGDIVVSTPMTCSATNEVISLRGAEIFWADIDEYGNMSAKTLSEALEYIDKTVIGGKNKIKAIMAVDWGGLPCDYDGLRSVANGIPIIEDAAHAFGALYNHQSISLSGGDYVAYSFQAIKHLTCGDGGLLVTPKEQYERAKLLRWYGLDRTKGDAMRCKQDILEPGYKFHMNDINATIGLANIKSVEWVLYRHRYVAQVYNEELISLGLLPTWPYDRRSSYWLYTIHIPRAREFELYAKEFCRFGATQVHNRNDKFSFLWKYNRELRALDKWYDDMVCIPCGWWMSDDDISRIIDSVIGWVENNGESGRY